jgi:hypothetical protein
LPTSGSQAAPTKQGNHIIYMAADMIVYIIKQDDDGKWGICREKTLLFRGMLLGPAIRLARDVARDEHHRSCRATCVDIYEAGVRTSIARYPKQANAKGQEWVSAFSVY